MKQDHSVCSDENLRQLLISDEDSDQAAAVAGHVNDCPQCQARLEELAASEDWWRETRDVLSHDELPIDGCAITGDDVAAGHARRAWMHAPGDWQSSTDNDALARQLLSPPSHPEMLGRIGRYEVERLIGAGGMGVVFKAFDTELNRPVAIKVLAPYLAGNGAARKRFAREARAAAAIVHEHVVAIHNVETEGKSPFLVMQFVAGESLQSRLDAAGPLELREILRIGKQTAAGLAAAHAQGIVHRDVKPSNILLEKGVERTLLTDFGLARASDDASLTHTGYHPGTPQYMSPEQVRGETVDARSDLFSLGSVLYAMCTGRAPFRAESSYAVLRRITDSHPRPIREVNPDIPNWLERLIQRLLAKSPEDRFDSAEQVAELLEQCLAHVQQPMTAALPSPLQYALKPRWLQLVASRRVAIAGVAACLLATALVATSPLNKRDQAANRGDARTTVMPPPAAAASSIAADKEITSWDASAHQIQQLEDDILPLEQQSNEMWGGGTPAPRP